MISKKMQNAINSQINAELYSAYMYLSMSAYFASQNLPGFANWMRVQAQEEVGHAMKLYGFVEEYRGRVVLKAIDGPPIEWDSPLAVFQATLKHEQKVTGLINKLVDQAIAENDHATRGFLQWFVDEQVEEEASADAIVQQLKLIKGTPGGLFMLDKELGVRSFKSEA
jgi:ferritin